MSESEREVTPVLPADAEEALIESTEVDNPTEDADTAQMQTDDNPNNGIDPDVGPTTEPANADEDADMDDLFGDDDEDVAPSKKRRLDDEELDSGDDVDRNDRMVEDEEPVTPTLEAETIQADVGLPRHATLKGSDGEVYLMNNAAYTDIEPHVFNPKTFTPPVTNHRSKEAPSANFSAAQTAASTIRWRRDPNDSSKLQGNSRIIRWSDGSLTLQIGSNATEQYELPAQAMARPQLRPRKPTPVSKPVKKGVTPQISKKQDAHTYLATIDESLGMARLTNHVTAVLNVRSTKVAAADDDAVLKLQLGLSAISAGKRGTVEGSGITIMNTVEDPDLLRKRAEQAEKEKAKAEKQRLARQERDEQRRKGVMGRASDYGRSRGMGLSVAGLEDEGGLGGYASAKKRAPPKKQARRNDYSDEEEEDLGQGRTKEDGYSKEGGFIVSSDEEEESSAGGDDDEEEELLDEDAEGEEDDGPVQPSVEKAEAAGGRKRAGRQVIDDDDDE